MFRRYGQKNLMTMQNELNKPVTNSMTPESWQRTNLEFFGIAFIWIQNLKIFYETFHLLSSLFASQVSCPIQVQVQDPADINNQSFGE